MTAKLYHTKPTLLMWALLISRGEADNNCDRVYTNKYCWMTLENVITLASGLKNCWNALRELN